MAKKRKAAKGAQRPSGKGVSKAKRAGDPAGGKRTKKGAAQGAGSGKKSRVRQASTGNKNPAAADKAEPKGRTAGKEREDLFPIVGIGASAGGLAALKAFFSHVPEESGLAYVVVVHLSPEHKSHLAELLQPHVKIPVQQVSKTVSLEPNTVYVIPPGANLDTIDTHLRLTKLEQRRHERAPIDHFFRTLAKTHDGEAIGVILTGSGSDGTLGIREIKEKGGLTIVQDPGDAEYDGMPQSAIASGMVDLVLPVGEIPRAVLRFARTQPKLLVPQDGDELGEQEHRLLQKVFGQLRARTGRDFSRYKRSTLLRRIQRRMQLNEIEDAPGYLELLRKVSGEVRILADDLLITVTSFFRDPEVFESLEKLVIPGLFAGKGDEDEIRIWSVGCATGEEAYSVGMLLLEEAARREVRPRMQIFASDLHDHSLQKAREGFFPGDIEADVAPERLQRFFTKENGGYRINKEVRELVVFAPHNLLADPPFSRNDLVCCRNLLIYIQREAQGDIVELFHYALRPDGFLVLGSSETLETRELFRVEDKKHCIYRKRNIKAPEPRLPVFPMLHRSLTGEATATEKPAEPLVYGKLHQQMVERYAPPSALVSPDDKVVHLSEHAGRYFMHPGGEPTTDVFKVVRRELRIELRACLQRVREQGKTHRSNPVPVRFNGESGRVVLDVRPAQDAQQAGFALVIFDEREAIAPEAGLTADESRRSGGRSSRGKKQGRERRLEAELEAARQNLQAVIEEYETSQEEMKVSNEEMQSTNEELRSTMEELETSKEELQSMNEELQAVNQENRHKVEELTQLSSYLQNLLTATDIATLFLDREFRILRFTPRVGELFNIRETDRGRPISDLTHRLGYDRLRQDAGRVVDKLAPIEREVQDESGRWYLTRVVPYRSGGDRIEGVVITFVEISGQKKAEAEVRQAKEFAERIIETLPDPLLVLTSEFVVRSANAAFYEHFRVTREQTLGQKVYRLGNGQWDLPELRRMLEEVLPENHMIRNYQVEHDFEELGRRVMLVSGQRLEEMELILLGLRDITEQHAVQLQMRQSEEQLAAELAAMNRLHELVAGLLVSPNLRTALEEVLEAAIDILGTGQGTAQLWDPETETLEIVASRGFTADFLNYFRVLRLDDESACARAARSGERVVVEDVQADAAYAPHRETAVRADYRAVQSTPLVSRSGGILGVLSTHYRQPYHPSERELRILDLYARQAADFIEHVRHREEMKLASQRKDEFLAMLSHELRNPLAPIKTGLDLLKMAEDKSAVFEEVHRTMERQMKQLVALVDDLLNVSRINRGVLKLKRQRVKLSDVIESALEESRPRIEEAGHELTVRVPRKDLTVNADPHRLAQVLSNLLDNAAKFTPRNGRIQLTAERNRRKAVLTVGDNGIGIAPEMRQRIFELFGQVGSPQSASGLGIGLSLAKSIVELHGGSIDVESAGPGRGTTFTIRLPAAASVKDDEPAPTAEETTEVSGLRILVVDDNKSAADMLSRFVESYGNNVRSAYDGEQACTIAAEFQPDAVVMDIGMPQMDGYEAARTIRRQPGGETITLIALTGWGQEEDRKKSVEAGFDYHLVKPAESTELLRLLAEVKSRGQGERIED